jgi:DNA-binding MarR family transcriptional regulator
MDADAVERFRQHYWQTVHEMDVIRLRAWERFGLTLPKLRVLYAVRRQSGITTGDLARALGITVSTTSGLVSKLVDRGLVERMTTPTDRRQMPLRLTEAGATLTGDVSEASRVYLDEVAAHLGDDLPAVVRALDTLAAAAARTRQTGVQAAAGEAEPDTTIREARA